MLADETRSHVKDTILAGYVEKIDQCPTVPDMVPPTVAVIKELAVEILTNLPLYLTTVDNSHEQSQELAEDIA